MVVLLVWCENGCLCTAITLYSCLLDCIALVVAAASAVIGTVLFGLNVDWPKQDVSRSKIQGS